MAEVIPSIDFETRSTHNIRLGLDAYFDCPEAGILMLAVRFPDMEQPEVWHRGPDMQQPPVAVGALARLLEHVAAGGRVRAWNAMFEWQCWNTLGAKLGWPPLAIEQCVDTMAQAAAQNLPQALGRCAEVLGLPADQQKDKRGKYLIQRLCVPHPPTKSRQGIWVQDADLFDEMVEYCRRDVVTEEAVCRKLRKLPDEQQAVWVATQVINRRGVPVAVEEVEKIADMVEAEKATLNAELHSLTGGAVPAASKRQQLLDWCNQRMADQGYMDSVSIDDPIDTDEDRPGHEEALPDLKGDTVQSALAKELPADVRRALEIRAAVVQTSTAKYAKMLSVQREGRLRGMYVWHGAGTGRWASRGGVNCQNFARPTLKKGDIATAFDIVESVKGADLHGAVRMLWGDRTMDVAVSCLRGVLKAEPGHRFINADYSSVENRVGVWLAGQQDKVDMFARGFDEYKVFSSKSLHMVPYEEVTPDMRQMSKSAVLGCLFGQGWKGLIEYARGYGVTLTPGRAQEIVKAYRSEYREVCRLWYRCGDGSVAAVRNPGQWVSAGLKLSLVCHKGFLWMKLPSGRMIAWASPRIEKQLAPWTEEQVVGSDENGNIIKVEVPVYRDVVTVESIETATRRFVRHPLIGSSIFQSAVQGTAADILADGVLALEKHGYNVVLMSHDELMSHNPVGFGSEDEFGALMCAPTPWRADLPLAYEAWAGTRYRK